MSEKTHKKVAYFSMEVGLDSKIPTYAGGLGILAGDTLKAAADVHFSMVGVTLLSKYGYFYQNLKDARQVESPVAWRVDDFLKPVETKVQVEIGGETVHIGCWVYKIFGRDGFEIPLYFLYTDLPENSKEARGITDYLYGVGREYRLKQEIVLGVGGVRMLKALGFTQLDRYHMNEGHSALLVTELLHTIQEAKEVKKRCIFTTHTPVPVGHDKFDIKLVETLLEKDLYKTLPHNYIKQKELNMTELALDYSGYINGVAKKHTEVSKSMFPNYPIHAITNGVHAQTWASHHFAHLYDTKIPNWRTDPSSLRTVSSIPNEDIWKTHFACKKQIIDFANAYTNMGLDYDYFTIGWARRYTAYKRPDFLLNNLDKLKEIAEKKGPIQIIYAGKAHPADNEGKNLIEKTITLSNSLREKVTMVYLTNYDMYLAKFITSGVDAWLNTPAPPHEASGTSGMKCALNGVPHISVLDGWWHEGYVAGKTGWAFSTPEELYELLENEIVPCFYNDKEKWREIMKNTVMINGSFFNAHRMINDYIKQAYKV